MESVGQKRLENEAENYKLSSQSRITGDHDQAQERDEDDHGSKRGGWITFPFIIGELFF